MARLRAGLIGVGMMGRHHARVLRSLDDLDLVAVASHDGDPHGVAGDLPLVDNVDDLIKIGIDLCVVAVPTAFHEEVGLALAAAGVHALVEKPLATTTASSLRLADAFAAAGLVGCVGHIERYNPAVLELRRHLDAGALGVVYQIVTRRQGPFPNRINDVGVVKDLATHDIDLTAWVTGQPYVSVSARTALMSGRPHEDLVAIVGQLADGTVTSHLVNWLSPMKERVTIVTGDRGCFVVDTLAAELTFYANASIPSAAPAVTPFGGVSEGDMIRYAINKVEPLASELAAFRDAVLGREAPIVTMREGLATVAVADAVLASAASGSTVTVADPYAGLVTASSTLT